MKIDSWRQWVKSLRDNTYALYLASKDPRVPLSVKIIIGAVVAYALSPIDLIPDFIPLIGFMDDLVLLPLGIWIAVRLLPREVWRECKVRAAEREVALPGSRGAAIFIVII